MIEFTDFTVYIIIAIIDACLVVVGVLFGMVLKAPINIFSKKKSSTVVDVEEVRCVIDDTEYITTTIKTKRKIEKRENEDELE